MSFLSMLDLQKIFNGLNNRLDLIDQREREDFQSIKDLLLEKEAQDKKQDKDIKKLKRAVNKLRFERNHENEVEEEEEETEENKQIPSAAFEELQKKVSELEDKVITTQQCVTSLDEREIDDIQYIKDSLKEVDDKDNKHDKDIM